MELKLFIDELLQPPIFATHEESLDFTTFPSWRKKTIWKRISDDFIVLLNGSFFATYQLGVPHRSETRILLLASLFIYGKKGLTSALN